MDHLANLLRDQQDVPRGIRNHVQLHPIRVVQPFRIECGFSDQSYFSKVFRRHTGTSPKEYRKRQHSRGVGAGPR